MKVVIYLILFCSFVLSITASDQEEKTFLSKLIEKSREKRNTRLTVTANYKGKRIVIRCGPLCDRRPDKSYALDCSAKGFGWVCNFCRNEFQCGFGRSIFS